MDDKQLSGKVIIAETGKVDSTLIVMLYQVADDSAVIKERPRYFTKLDRAGNFTFRYLPVDTFYLYALKDEGGSRRYLSKAQLFGFADKPVIIGDSNLPVTLVAYSEELEETAKPATRPPVKKDDD